MCRALKTVRYFIVRNNENSRCFDFLISSFFFVYREIFLRLEFRVRIEFGKFF